jgi:hypothetical protein
MEAEPLGQRSGARVPVVAHPLHAAQAEAREGRVRREVEHVLQHQAGSVGGDVRALGGLEDDHRTELGRLEETEPRMRDRVGGTNYSRDGGSLPR